MRLVVLVMVFFTYTADGQSGLLHKTIQEIEFSEDTIHSVFNWMAGNIKYDVKKAEEFRDRSRKKDQKYRNEEERNADLLMQVIKKKKGVCQDYSLLFDAILRELGYESYIVKGYTKNDKGKVNKSLGHTWNAVKVNGAWKLYDPTWAAGYVDHYDRFIQEYNEEWYDVLPETMIRTHMPYDPMWQLSSHPIPYSVFENNLPIDSVLFTYDYKTLLDDYCQKSPKDQMRDELARSLQMGDGIRLVQEWRRYKEKDIGLFDIQSQPELMDKLVERSNKNIALLNDYNTAKRKRFSSKKWTPEYARNVLDNAKRDFTEIMETLEGMEIEDRRGRRYTDNMISQTVDILEKIDTELEFLNQLQSAN